MLQRDKNEAGRSNDREQNRLRAYTFPARFTFYSRSSSSFPDFRLHDGGLSSRIIGIDRGNWGKRDSEKLFSDVTSPKRDIGKSPKTKPT